jgi:hypothetical protein
VLVLVVVGRKLFVMQPLLIGTISISWVKDENIWRGGGTIIDGGMPKNKEGPSQSHLLTSNFTKCAMKLYLVPRHSDAVPSVLCI